MTEKIKVNNNVFVYPMPVTLLGANVEGKANFMALDGPLVSIQTLQ